MTGIARTGACAHRCTSLPLDLSVATWWSSDSMLLRRPRSRTWSATTSWWGGCRPSCSAMSEPLDERGLGDYIDRRYRAPGDTLFRMETLPAYVVDSDGEDYRRWLGGAEEPTWSRKRPWLDTLRRERRNGQMSRRVRVLSAEVTPYERYSCAF